MIYKFYLWKEQILPSNTLYLEGTFPRPSFLSTIFNLFCGRKFLASSLLLIKKAAWASSLFLIPNCLASPRCSLSHPSCLVSPLLIDSRLPGFTPYLKLSEYTPAPYPKLLASIPHLIQIPSFLASSLPLSVFSLSQAAALTLPLHPIPSCLASPLLLVTSRLAPPLHLIPSCLASLLLLIQSCLGSPLSKISGFIPDPYTKPPGFYPFFLFQAVWLHPSPYPMLDLPLPPIIICLASPFSSHSKLSVSPLLLILRLSFTPAHWTECNLVKCCS